MSARSRVGAVRRRTRAAASALRGSPAAASGPSDPVAAAMQRDQDDFGHMRRLLAFTLAPDSNCIDIGAHRGAVLAEMCRVAPLGKHIAFEPIPELCAYLREQFPAVEVHQAAVSDNPGVAEFSHVRGHAEGWSGLKFRPLPTGEEADVEQLEVKLEVLDETLDPDYKPSVIKIDVEGAEEQVFRGALNTLRRHRPIVIFEHGSGSAEFFETTPADIYALLSNEAGYRIFDLDGNGPYSLDKFKRTFHSAERVNFVARP